MTTTEAQITTYEVLPYKDRRSVWEMYVEAFEPLRTRAAQRHVLFHDEWTELMDDPRVSKILAHDGDMPLGLALVTNDLKAVPLIEPAFFAEWEPDRYARSEVWYVPFVCTRQSVPRPPADTFARLIIEIGRPIARVRGACFIDYATCVVDRGLPAAANAIMLSAFTDRALYHQVDAQTYWRYYPGGI